MPWEFRATCPECSHEWEALTYTEWIGSATSDTPVRRFFCPDCTTHVSIATDFDRASFQNWLRGHQHYLTASGFLAHNIGLIVAICDSTPGYLLPLDTLWSQLHCPPCDTPLVEGSMDAHPVTCPNCGKCNAKSHGCHAHVSVLRDVDDQT
ncbi:hypothetical protein MFFC18_47350 [Mariniblastus fucicola]|uniref:Uncharacterized protein n=1 Tax=Mariniblastus fucicola TaxID=980251 RepID=A0A5B9PJE5_9BACT|nr:hypothetical protein MFFC18_47330 [Mariniblastus fucicola]QEG24812.1 hypothetical protein MFFC18_47350 [Mariniblastus fucicola]